MRLLGDKIAARRLAAEAGVPVVPGEESAADCDEALAAADSLGYPGARQGGVRRRRQGHSPRAGAAPRWRRPCASPAARRRRLSATAIVYVEKFLEPVRHVEVQFLADAHGNVVALGERECSIQRRHQKLIEESPSPAVDVALRERLCAAVRRSRARGGYRNAGTAEFLLDETGRFYFLEINARLQVEHPVTELVDRHRSRWRSSFADRRRRAALLRAGGRRAARLGDGVSHRRRGPVPRLPAVAGPRRLRQRARRSRASASTARSSPAATSPTTTIR